MFRPSPKGAARTRPFVVGAGLALAIACTAAAAAAYRYRDANGQWVYTDRPPTNGREAQALALGAGGAVAPKITVVPRSTPAGVALVAVNECHCVVEFAVRAQTAAGARSAQQVVPARSEATLLELATAATPAAVRYDYGYVVGEPGVSHRPSTPYRAPFATAGRFLVSQAPPDAVTHVDASSRQAIDIAMPVGTAVHAARAGIVINVARDHFRSGLQVQDLHEANFVQILHDDGTYAIYAHLQLDTVRVRPGQRVERGEFIANSGNTGFSSGPHLHFVVLRNAGLRSESLPVTFAGPGGSSVVPRTGQVLEAY
ncbi:MAG TPA: peptidoglycan DD-metalloendopeptidase family protein [Steroidobacteraceae bacterium]